VSSRCCPDCNLPMLPLFTGLYCSEAPPGRERCGPHEITVSGGRWQVARVRRGMVAPSWATRGWHLSGIGTPGDDPGMSLRKLVAVHQEMWNDYEGQRPGWDLDGLEDRPFPSDGLVFGPLGPIGGGR